MKKGLILAISAVFIYTMASGQKSISRSLITDGINHLAVININGSVTATATSQLVSSLHAESPDFDSHLIPLMDTIVGDTMIIYLGVPGVNLRISKYGWGYDWERKETLKAPRYDIEIKANENLNILLSTIEEGDIVSTGFSKPVSATNINGSIKIHGSTRSITAINGPVDIHWEANPPDSARLYSLNGDITMLVPGPFDGDVTFSSWTGDFYTDIENHQTRPVHLTKSQKGEGTVFKIKGTAIVFGSGGPHLDCETFNGNVIIRHKKQ